MEDNTKQKLKQEGLKYAETLTAESVDCIFNLLEIIIKDSENKIDDMLLSVLEPLKAIILQYVDKIDGVQG